MFEQTPRGQEQQKLTPELEQKRLLTEVEHIREHLDWRGNVPPDIAADVKQNMATALNEAAMPYAVTTTYHKVEYREANGRRERVITWLGKTAVETAQSGYEFHFSEAAKARTAIEVNEAIRDQSDLRGGVAHIFISPKMSPKDATAEVANAEHMHDDDAIRVSKAIVNSEGRVAARQLQSLLVRGIPLEAWVAMLKDPENIFGRSFVLRDEQSALSVMELFAQLDLPEESIAEGPAGLVEAVLPYIPDASAQESVRLQLERFRKDQALYHEQAQLKTEEWYAFDLEIARSLETGWASYGVAQRIVTMQHEWDAQSLRVITRHAAGNMRYRMTPELAEILERGIRTDIERRAAVMTNNDRAMASLGQEARAHIVRMDSSLQAMRSAGIVMEEVFRAQAQLSRFVVRQNIRTGGGCAGSVKSVFGANGDSDKGLTHEGSDIGLGEDKDSQEDKSNWKWKKGVCQVPACPTRPGQTEVGPCSVCRRCQSEFDAGRDPTKGSLARKVERMIPKAPELSLAARLLGERTKRQAKELGRNVLEVVSESKKR